jgi:hypothetical protein
MATSKEKKLEIKIEQNISDRLTAIMMNNEFAKMLIDTYLTGKELQDKNFSIRADFKLVETDKKEQE